jgi:hypothetical protein
LDDCDAYAAFPDQRKWFNKLWLAEKLGYYCGPSGIAPNKSGYYIVRPILNLSGMSAFAKKKFIDAGDMSKTPPGYFWCEWFDGTQYSVTYEWQERWKQVSCYIGERDEDNLYRFHRWTLVKDKHFEIGSFFDELATSGVKVLNVEFIDDNIIEAHLRDTPDPKYEELIPIWKDSIILVDKYEKLGYTYIESHDDADGFLDTPRIGFMIK